MFIIFAADSLCWKWWSTAEGSTDQGSGWGSTRFSMSLRLHVYWRERRWQILEKRCPVQFYCKLHNDVPICKLLHWLIKLSFMSISGLKQLLGSSCPDLVWLNKSCHAKNPSHPAQRETRVAMQMISPWCSSRGSIWQMPSLDCKTITSKSRFYVYVRKNGLDLLGLGSARTWSIDHT